MAVNPSVTSQTLTSLLDGSLDLVVAFKDPVSRGLAYELVRAEINDALRNAARSWLKRALRAYRDDEPLTSDPDRPLRPGEWFSQQPQTLGLDSLSKTLAKPEDLNVLDLQDLSDRDPSWYAFVARAADGKWGAFV